MTDANLHGIYCGSTDIPLNEEGISGLSELLNSCAYPYAEWVFSSPLSRAKETAKLLYGDTEIIEIEDLREMSFGEFEGKSMSELKNNDLFAGFITGKPHAIPKGAETPEAFFSRCEDAIISIVKLMMTSNVHSAAVITHASIIGNILAYLAYPKAQPYEWNPNFGCGYTVIADPTLFLREPVLEVIAEIPKYYDDNDLFDFGEDDRYLYD